MYYAYTARSVLNGIRVNASEKVVRQAFSNYNKLFVLAISPWQWVLSPNDSLKVSVNINFLGIGIQKR